MLLAFGPELQEQLLGLLNSDAPSLYGTAYNDRLHLFLSLQSWLLLGADPFFIVQAGAIAWAATEHALPRKIAFSSAVATFILLYSSDLASAAVGGSLTLPYAYSNAIADIAGALAISGIILAFSLGADLVTKHLPTSSAGKLLAANLAVLVTGVLLATALYYADRLLYEPVPAHLELYAMSPLSGYYAPGEPNADEDIAPFKVVSRSIGRSSFYLRNPTNDSPSVSWQRLLSAARYDVAAQLYENCDPSSPGFSTSPPRDAAYFSNATDAAVAFNPGPVELHSITTVNSDASIEIVADGPQMFWLADGTKPQATSLTEFLGEDQDVTYLDPDDPAVYLSAPLLGNDAIGIVEADRGLSLTIDGQTRSVQIRRAWIDLPPPRCRPLDTRALIENGHITLTSHTSSVGLALYAIRTDRLGRASGERPSEFRLAHLNGWLEVPNVPEDVLRGPDSGSLNFFSISGNITNLRIDGVSFALVPGQHFLAAGDFLASFEAGGQFRIIGDARAFWQDQSRLNPTRWERLSWDMRLGIAAAASSLVGAIFFFVLRAIRRDAAIGWLDT